MVTLSETSEEEAQCGWPVKILRGKHGGKTGTIEIVYRKYVRVIEDVTDLEVRNSRLVYMHA